MGSVAVAARIAPGVSHSLRTVVFGKRLNTIEYPQLERPVTVILRWPTIDALRRVIARETSHMYCAQSETIPTDVKTMAVFSVPHFTQPLVSNKDVRIALFDRSWIMWTRSNKPIPSHVKPMFNSGKLSDTVVENSMTVFVLIENEAFAVEHTIKNDENVLETLKESIAKAPGDNKHAFQLGVTHKKFPNVVVRLESR